MIKATYVEHMGSDLSVVNAARVSFGKSSAMEANTWGPPTLEERDAKLIKYLAKHKHTSPFGHAFASFHVKAPIFVARQLVKHKFLRWNEISRRYVDDEPEFYVPAVWRGRSEDKKQGSSDTSVDLDAVGLDGVTPPHESGWEASLLESIYGGYSHTLGNYDALIKAGVAPEQARMVLPQSTMTEWYWSGSLDAFADMCRLRCKSDTQYETRIVADQINEIMQPLFPVAWQSLLA
jgi:thymidylate synthase (FAD)